MERKHFIYIVKVYGIPVYVVLGLQKGNKKYFIDEFHLLWNASADDDEKEILRRQFNWIVANFNAQASN